MRRRSTSDTATPAVRVRGGHGHVRPLSTSGSDGPRTRAVRSRREANSSAASEAATEVGASLLPSSADHGRDRLEVQQRGEGVLAQHQRDGDERGRGDARPDVGQHHPHDHRAPAGAQGAGGLGQRHHVDGRRARCRSSGRRRAAPGSRRRTSASAASCRTGRTPRRRRWRCRPRSPAAGSSTAAGRGTPPAWRRPGTRRRTQIIVGVSSTSISSVVSRASSSEEMIEVRSISSRNRFAHGLQRCARRR